MSSFPQTADTVQPWRATALVACVVATVELIVLVGAGVALLGKPLAAHAKSTAIERLTPAPVAVHVPKAAVPKLPRGETSILVLNGNGLAGAAASAAAEVRAHGYRIGATANAARSDYPRSVVMYRAGFEGEARRLARDLAVKVVGPLDGMSPRTLHGAQLALVLGSG